MSQITLAIKICIKIERFLENIVTQDQVINHIKYGRFIFNTGEGDEITKI